MIRFILRRKTKDTANGLETDQMETHDCEAPGLEQLLARGGCGESGYDYTALIGAQIIVRKDKS